MTGRQNHEPLTERRVGVMIHYDASRSDKGAVAWLTTDPTCRVSYHWLVTDDGTAHTIAPHDRRAWHAGRCRSSDPQRLAYRDANSAFYGVAVAATAGDTITAPQLATVARLVRECFERERWPLADTWRIVGHSSEAWHRGRKHDPEGLDPQRPVLSVATVRQQVAA